MSDQASLEVKVVASVDAARAQMQALAGTMSQVAREMRGSMGAATADTARQVGGLTQFLKDQRQEMRGQSGVVNLFTRELGSLAGAAGVSKDALGAAAGILGAFAYGGVVGVAFEAVKLLGEAFVRDAESMKKFEEQLKKTTDWVRGEATKAFVEFSKARIVAAGGSPAESEAWERGFNVLRKRNDLVDALRGAENQLGDAVKENTTIFGTQSELPIDNAIETSKKKVEEAKKALEDFDKEAKKVTTYSVGTADYKAETKAREEAEKEQARQRKEASRKEAEAERQYQDYRNTVLLAGEKAGLSEREEAGREYWATLRRLRTDDTEAAVAAEKTLHAKLAEVDKKDAEKKSAEAKKEAKKHAEEMKKLMDPVKDTLTSVFDSLISGGQSTGQIIEGIWKNVAQTMIRSLADVAAQAIVSGLSQATTSAGVAGAKAAESQAGIPIVGPGLALSMMASVIAGVMGTAVALIGSASGGADLPSFSGSRMFALHSEEMVLPAPIANTVRESMGGNGGGEMSMNFYGPTDRQWFQSRQRELTRSLRRLQRRGKIR